MRALPALALLLVVGAACKKEPKPVPLPPMCVKVAHGGDEQIDQVRCAGRDEDKDGIDDAVDNCLSTKEIYNGILDRDGCPDPDADLDEFVDTADACPQQKGGPPNGCAKEDADGDGIADYLDACPNAAEDVDGDNDSDGCPEGETQTVAQSLSDQLWSRREIMMRVGSARPTRQGQKELALLADDVIARSQELVRARIVVYTNRREPDSLLRPRAKRVRDALLKAGLNPAQLEQELKPKSGWNKAEVFLYVRIGDEKIEVPAPPGAPAGAADADPSAG